MSEGSENALKLEWRIENVKSWLQNRDDTLYSPQFEALRNTRWKLGLFQNWQLAEKYASVFLQRDIEDYGPELIDLNYELSFLESDGFPLKSISFMEQFSTKTISSHLNIKIEVVEVLVKESKAYTLDALDGALTICCKLWNTLPTLSKEKYLTLKTVIGTKQITLKAAVENFYPSSSAVVNFVPRSEDISLISLDVFETCESGKKNCEFGFNKRYVQCKGVSWYSLVLYALDAEGYPRKIREISNSIKCSPVEISSLSKYTKPNFMYYENDMLKLRLVVYYHPGVVLESTQIEPDSFENLPCRFKDPEITKVSNSEKVPFSIPECISLTKLYKDENEWEKESEDSAKMTYLPLTKVNGYSAILKIPKRVMFCLEKVPSNISKSLSLTNLENEVDGKLCTALSNDSSAPRDYSAGPRDYSTAPREESTAPREESTAPRDESTAPRDDSTAPRDDSPAPRDDSPAPRDDSPAPREESTAPRELSTTLKIPESMSMSDLELPLSVSNSPFSIELDDEQKERLNSSEKSFSPLTTLKDDLTSLYNDRLFCDTNLQFDTETLPAHRSILSARSPVFKRIFMNYVKEKPSDCIQVPGINQDTARRMLQFLYTDCLGEIDFQSAKDLYVASVAYDIASLKTLCTSFIKKNLHLSNVCEVLALADVHQDKDLESAAQEYVLTNVVEIFYSEEWKIFMKNYGCLAAQVMYLNFTKSK